MYLLFSPVLHSRFSLVTHFILFFYWSIIALWCCVSFCCTMKGVSYTYTYIFPLGPPSPAPLTQLGHHRTLRWAPCAIQQVPMSYFTHGRVYMSILTSQFVSPSPLPWLSPHRYVHMSIFYICVSSCPGNRFICAIFSRFHIYTSIYNICFLIYSVWQTLGPSTSL